MRINRLWIIALLALGVWNLEAREPDGRAKATKKAQNFKALVCAADGECFWTRDGRILQNLEDLHMAFGSMDEEVFLHHVNKEKNDFADWVEHILDDLDCSIELRKSKELAKAHKILQSHLQKYSVA